MSEPVRAAVKVDVERSEIQEFDRPRVAPDSALLRVESSGVGGSDPELYRWKDHAPVIMGHENVGTIDEIGPIAAQRWGVKVGDRVALHEYLPCWHCRWCRQGDFRLCEEADFFLVKDRFRTLRFGMCDCRIAPHLWGGFAQYLHLPFNTVVHKIPADMPAHLATLAIPLGNGFQWAVLDGGAGPGKTVLVLGPGQQGLGCVFAAKAAGAFCVILAGHSRDRSRLALAPGLGADFVVDAEQEDLRERVRAITGGRGVDVVVDTTGDPTGQVAADAVALAAKGAYLNLNGLGQKVNVGDVKKLYLTVRAPRGHSYTAVDLALKYLYARQDTFRTLCSHSYPLKDVDTAIRATAGRGVEGAIHVTVDPWA
ncbi:MAG TPA: zinc-binding dehydrogenase [Steroidobacteraceae bacterium]|nr:zinc-binding dehydrogenase [Steroidobacteraceae bacterium]